ncbi:hypothetical protein GCM10009765_03220 [Fodinicola feengrottensis]|uniref:DUF3560 domain-containing protein n=1 Tax=Fodinicola feengrottensis TaxID=435914 RepID=A0ABN2FR17_9ACTN
MPDHCGSSRHDTPPPDHHNPHPDPPVIQITHSHATGTRVEGSGKGDGVWEIAREQGFRYSRDVGIYLRLSRDKNANEPKINALKYALERAGFAVQVDIDNTWRAAADREADRGERIAAHADRLRDRADRATARSSRAEDRAQRITDLIPLGQPILVGHHSETRARRDQAHIDAAMTTASSEAEYASKLAARAHGAAANEAAKHAGPAIMRRIQQLESNKRILERHLALQSASGDARQRTQDKIDRLADDITHQHTVLGAMADAGVFVAWTTADFQPGDQVCVRGWEWRSVSRVNKKTVRVDNRDQCQLVEMDRITGLRRDGQQWDTPHGQPWPVELAVRVARWEHLLAAASVPSNAYSDTTRHVRWAQRLVHGLDLDAADAELAAFHPERATLDVRRGLASTYLGAYKRLTAGEPIPDVTESLPAVDLTPDWRLPDTPAVDRRVDQLRSGDLIKGIWDLTGNARILHRRFAGPVDSISDPLNRHESGTWIGVRLRDGEEEWLQTHRWLSTYPQAAQDPPSSPATSPCRSGRNGSSKQTIRP